jgi:hypothetical protein
MKKMFKFKGRLCLILFVLITISTFLPAQQKQENTVKAIQNILHNSSEYYGEDDNLVNGCVYALPDSRIKGSPYLNEENWSEGAVYINGKCYKNLLLKYDLLIDALVLNIKINDNNNRLINLNKSQVDSFLIGNRLFVNSRIILTSTETQTFYEQINSNDYRLLIKHKKVFLKTYNDITPYGRYSAIRSDRYILHNGLLANANSTGSFLSGFGNIDKKKVKNYMKQNGINYSNALSDELKVLMYYCNEITQGKNEN